ncbi:hypothetical protein [Oceanobacillus chungangensis]|uniref:DUF3679 domain-containing protein n=1 Tax=Oceanobacillus chungangensis TaxID=1229152 RepID=A0A3D8PZY1_9BACI|nr:hypothetical protein [Oceanobacillus chungangensis]RDW21750.1 hypothetical protein CWR45_02425 [Oceanobacillus chungangensis]
MVRTFIVILLLAVFFLAGTLYGSDRNQDIANVSTAENIDQTSSGQIPVVTKTEVVNEMTTGNLMEMEQQEQFIPKFASFLEVVVTGFYEIVVEVLYQIAQLFF